MRITKRIREMVNSERAIAYWEALPEDSRRCYFENARIDTQIAVAAESFQYLRGRRGYYGRGSATAQAVDDAYYESAEFKELRRKREEERRAEFEAREYDCLICGRKTIARRSMVAGDQAQCYDCCPPKWKRIIDRVQ